MSIEIHVPVLPESVADATLITWHKKIGDFVNIDENLVDLETDKVVLEVPSPKAGTLTSIHVKNNSLVHGGDLLATLELSTPTDAQLNESTDSATVEKTNAVALSPAVRRLIAEKNLDPQLITGTGKGQRITKSDVENYLTQQKTPRSNLYKPAEKMNTSEEPTSQTRERPEQRVPMTRLRAKIAERLLQAQQNAAMLTTFNEVDMQQIKTLRTQHQERFTAKHHIKLGFMSFFIKAAVNALKEFPTINASIDEHDIIYHGYYDIGIAVASPRGLVVPVLRDADSSDFAGIENTILDFATKAKQGTLTYDELKGGTFTITNGGTFGSMLSTPIINPPQCAILGMHAIKERPVIVNSEIVIRPIMYLALSYDHRLVDGSEAVQFLVKIKESLESPEHLLLNI